LDVTKNRSSRLQVPSAFDHNVVSGIINLRLEHLNLGYVFAPELFEYLSNKEVFND
jgi:hypothetical protein